MNDRKYASATSNSPTRRQLIAGAAFALGAAATGARLWAQTQQPPAMQEPPPNPANQARTSLHQEVTFAASPQRIYTALLDSAQFATLTGLPATIIPAEGGAFSMFGGIIVGRQIELIPNQRIVQAWRPKYWDPGVYSMVKFELKPQDSATLIVLDHTGFPEGTFDGLNSGWPPRYWDPLKKFLAAQSAG
jgi:activator of HSP90 ATPase